LPGQGRSIASVVEDYAREAAAAACLGISQPAVSEVIAELEHTLSSVSSIAAHAVSNLIICGRAIFHRREAAFDELKQGIRDIEFLAELSAGQVGVGCPESIAASILLPASNVSSINIPTSHWMSRRSERQLPNIRSCRHASSIS
jgi:DNA-binding transcriptional LysR family regulator